MLSKAAQNPQNSNTVIYSEWKLKTEWKIEYWEANGPHPWLSKSRGRFHMVKSLLFSSSPVLENMFTHSYGRNLFNTRTEDCAAQRPHKPPDEGSRSRTKRKKLARSLGIFIWNVGRFIAHEKWKVDAFLGLGQRTLKTIFHSMSF